MVDNTCLNNEEAKEFHAVFSSSMTAFIVVAAIAHALVYFWVGGWGPAKCAFMDTAAQAVTLLS